MSSKHLTEVRILYGVQSIVLWRNGSATLLHRAGEGSIPSGTTKMTKIRIKIPMTILWLAIWAIKGAPSVYMWNNWAVGLSVCFAIDVFGLQRR